MPSPGANSYYVLRSTTKGGPYTTIGAAAGNSYTDTIVESGTTYYYVVEAVYGTWISGDSSEVSATTLPAPPTGLTATGATAQVALSWTASAGATGYSVLRATVSGGPYTLVGFPPETNLTDTSLTAGTAYYYVVLAGNASGTSGRSSEASAVTIPAAPTGLTATGGSGQVALSWTTSVGATAFVVFRSLMSGCGYSAIATPASPGYTDLGLGSATTYYYVVNATNRSGTSGNSAEATATTVPAAPMGLTATVGVRQVSLSWTASTGATGYLVFRSTVSGGPYTQEGTTVGTTFTDSGLPTPATYYYVVRAASSAGLSANSAEVVASIWVLWAKAYGGANDDVAYSIQQTSDGGYIVAGYTTSFGAGSYDFWVLKLDSSGNVTWQKAYGGANDDRAQSIQQTSDGGYIVAGGTSSFGAGNGDFWVLKLDSSGNVTWQKTYGGAYFDSADSIQQTSDGGYIVAGFTFYFGAGNGDFWVLKLGADGSMPFGATSAATVTVTTVTPWKTSVTPVSTVATVGTSSATVGGTSATVTNTNATITQQAP